LEAVEDFDHEGRAVLGSRLGYRITPLFVERFLGRIFETPDAVLTDELLRPETQDRAAFAAGIDAIVEAQRRVATLYFEDGSVEAACPPLKALLHIMAHGYYEGMSIHDTNLRSLFTRESLLESEWYAERLRTKQQRDVNLWTRHVQALASFSAGTVGSASSHLDLAGRLRNARVQLERVSAPAYLEELAGTLGADPFHGQI